MTRRTTTKPRRRAVGYVRISALMGRTQGDDLLSDVIQRDKVKAWCDFNDVELLGFYEDVDRSGRRGAKRPEFERLLADGQSGKFDVAVVYKFDRFARSVIDAAQAIEDLSKHGVGFVSATEQIDTTTAAGRMLVTILFAVAEMQSERISEDWRNAHEQRRKRGEAHVATGLFGYDTVREEPDGSTVKGARIVGVNEPEAAAVRLAFEMRVEGFGPAAIRDRLHGDGFRPARGGEWFAASTLANMLRNPTYAGLLRMPDGELVRSPHEPIVPLDVWERAQARPKRTLRARHATSDTSFLVGLIFCAGCGGRMKFQRRGDRAPVFRCWARQRSKSCPTPGQSILARRLEDYVVEQLLLNRASFEGRRADAALRDSQTSQRLRHRDAEVVRMIERLTARIARTDDEAVAEQYDLQLRTLVTERATIGDLLAEIEVDAHPKRQMPPRSTWESLSIDEQRVLVRGLIRRLEVSKSEVRGGSHARGIDFEQRVNFLFGWEWSAAWDAIEQVLDNDDELRERGFKSVRDAIDAAIPIVFEH